ncbi:MAG TPA: hypothetical protein VNH44_09665 [Micropepsaceae bacterium]|nr:hypothetical protein [Micropepsaceae bacterium]
MPSPAPDTREQRILLLWERGIGLNRWARDEALLAALGPPPARLGQRNAALLSLRSTLFDRAWPLVTRCPECGTDCEFEADSAALADKVGMLETAEETIVELGGEQIVLRAPTADDLRRISTQEDQAVAARSLLALCVSPPRAADSFDDHALTELGAHLENLDPGAMVSFTLSCPACLHVWSSDIDVGEALWAELQRAAEQTFVEIDALARAYGWRETDVLGMSAVRRAAYLQLAGLS